MLQSPNNNFDQQVKKTLENASVEPPAFLWSTIEEKLPSNKAWYSKYKYLLLLLLLSATSTTSIFVYKTIISKDTIKEIAVNKRMSKDETVAHGEKQRAENSSATTTSSATSNTSVKKNEKLPASSATKTAVTKPSVSTFYAKDVNGNETDASKFAQQQKADAEKRAVRLSRFAVVPEQQNTSAKNKISTTAKTTVTVTENTLAASIIESNTEPAAVTAATEIPSAYDNSVSTQETVETNEVSVNDVSIDVNVTNDVTVPIAEPVRPTNSDALTASVVPVNVQLSPIQSRELLRSLIEPGKLENLDIESQAIGISDLNPNREKMLKNLKQFSGYDINKGFHFGAFININNVWLNKKEFSKDENTQSITPKITFGKSYGINIGYDYTDRFGIQLEWQISEQGQRYKVGYKDGFKSKDIHLLYTKLPLMVKYKQTFINNYNSKPIAWSFVFGPQIGFLLKKKATLDGAEIKNLPEYNKVEFGFLGGFDFDLFMTRNVAMTIGARSGLMSSMRRGQPMSFQLGVTTQFNFRFPKKIK